MISRRALGTQAGRAGAASVAAISSAVLASGVAQTIRPAVVGAMSSAGSSVEATVAAALRYYPAVSGSAYRLETIRAWQITFWRGVSTRGIGLIIPDLAAKQNINKVVNDILNAATKVANAP